MIKLLAYYCSHSLINQVRKLLKTWFLIFLVCCGLLGVIIGGVASKVDENISEEYEEQEVFEEIIDEAVTDEYGAEAEETSAMKRELLKLGAGAVIAFLFVMVVLTADEKGLMIFQPADTTLLFTSPMTPQSVLMFRVFCQMGLYIFFTIYFMIEVPMLKDLFDLSTLQAASLVLTLGMTLGASVFVRILISLYSSIHPGFKKTWSYGLYVLIALVAGAFLLYYKSGDSELLEALTSFFNAKAVLLIPLIGWLKGLVVFALEEKPAMFLLCFAGVILAICVILKLIKSLKVDFYEEAMKKAEEVANIQKKMEKSGSIFVRGKKSDKQIEKEKDVARNRLNFGKGAAMFFIRPMYNRFRFAKGRVVTKTLVTYTLVTVLASALCLKSQEDLYFIPAAVVSLFVFFRTLGNPLREDTDNLYFFMAPQPAWQKLAFSSLAGAAACVLDILPGMVISGIMLGAGFTEVLTWILFIATLDYFATGAGAFVNMSLPQNAGATVKQVMQILFLYFGLIPDIVLIAICMSRGYELTNVILLAAAINFVLGTVFLALAVPFVDPRGGKAVLNGVPGVDRKTARGTFSRAGFMAAIAYLVTFVIQLAVLNAAGDGFKTDGVMFYVFALAPLYLAGMPLGFLIFRGCAKNPIEKRDMSLKRFIKFFPVVAFTGFTGSLVGNLLSLWFTSMAEQNFVNPVQQVLEGQSVAMQILFVVILGPVAEEIFFRKIIIDRLSLYGEKAAILVSAVIFGLFHGNVPQTTYTIFLGLIFGYVYVRTGKLRYSIILHVCLNFFSGIVPTYILSNIDFDALEAIGTVGELVESGSSAITALGVYYLVMILLSLIGLVILCAEGGRLEFRPAERELFKGARFKTAFLNPGVICFAVLMIFLIVNGYAGFFEF